MCCYGEQHYRIELPVEAVNKVCFQSKSFKGRKERFTFLEIHVLFGFVSLPWRTQRYCMYKSVFWTELIRNTKASTKKALRPWKNRQVQALKCMWIHLLVIIFTKQWFAQKCLDNKMETDYSSASNLFFVSYFFFSSVNWVLHSIVIKVIREC